MSTEKTAAHAIHTINFAKKFSMFSEQWAPKVVAEMNDYQFKIVRLQGDFIWHAHASTDETLSCWKGCCASIFAMATCWCRRAKWWWCPRESSTSRPPKVK